MAETLDDPMAKPRPVEASSGVAAHVLAGTGRRLVVCLSGVGRDRAAPPPPEFVGTASGGGRNHCLFLSDSSRSWLNGDGVAAEMVRIIEEYRDANDIDEVVTFGNAMGGYAALILPDLTEIRIAIAFAPQFSMHPGRVPEETRWSHFVQDIDTWPHPDIGPLRAEGTAYYIFHGDNPWEARHWLRFPWRRAATLNHFIFVGHAHNIASILQKRRMLGRVVDLAIENRPRAVRQALIKSFLGRSFLAQRREHYQAGHPDLTLEPGGAPMIVPAEAEDAQ